jgi:flavodoxin
MRVLITYYSKTGNTKIVAETIKEYVKKAGHEVELYELIPKEKLRAYEYKKLEKVELEHAKIDVKPYKLIFIGTPVWNFSPTPIVAHYLREAKNVNNKRFALFATCIALPGTTIKRLSNILATRNARVVNSIVVRSMFKLERKRLKFLKRFVEETLAKASNGAKKQPTS